MRSAKLCAIVIERNSGSKIPRIYWRQTNGNMDNYPKKGFISSRFHCNVWNHSEWESIIISVLLFDRIDDHVSRSPPLPLTLSFITFPLPLSYMHLSPGHPLSLSLSRHTLFIRPLYFFLSLYHFLCFTFFPTPVNTLLWNISIIANVSYYACIDLQKLFCYFYKTLMYLYCFKTCR